MLKIAHRGHSEKGRENTLYAFETAKSRGFDMIEMDIQLDKNDEIVIYHDVHMDFEMVETMTFLEMKRKCPELLRLSDLFEQFDYTNIRIYLDMKGSYRLAFFLCKLLVKMKINMTNIWLASFNIMHLELVQSINPEYKVGYITSNTLSNEQSDYIVNKCNIRFICYNWDCLYEENIQRLHEQGVMVFYYTLSNPKILYYTSRFDLDGIVSDIRV